MGRSPAGRRRTSRERGQVLVMFAAGVPLFLGVMAVVIDIGSFWNSSIHVQLAAEAAALAGVPYMPGDFTTAASTARAEAAKNGFSAAGGATVTPQVNAESNRRLDVTISASSGTYFMRIFGMGSVQITRTATAEYTLPVPMGSPLSVYGDNSGNFWAAAETQGSNRGYGDAFGTYYNPSPALNSQYDATGYQYGIEVPVGAGATDIDLYDPTFCAVSDDKGTGDHWIPWDQSTWPAASIYYTLWSDPAATPLDYSDDVQIASSGTLFVETPGGQVGDLPRDPGDVADPCLLEPARLHDRCLPQPVVDAGDDHHARDVPAPGDDVEPEQHQRPEGDERRNMWSLRAVPTNAGYRPHVYGLGKMLIYANVTNGTTLFYLARIEAVHAGKTMVIQLFDPGDASGNSKIEILQPTTTGHVATKFNYTADANASGSKAGTAVTSLKTTISGDPQYNNSWVTITVALPKTYAAPLPPGEPSGTLGGWWKVRYTYDSATTDTTTWQVSIRGNPVHLVQP